MFVSRNKINGSQPTWPIWIEKSPIVFELIKDRKEIEISISFYNILDWKTVLH